jgi:hypothetical protein
MRMSGLYQQAFGWMDPVRDNCVPVEHRACVRPGQCLHDVVSLNQQIVVFQACTHETQLQYENNIKE